MATDYMKGWTPEAIAANAILADPALLAERLAELNLNRFLGDALLKGRAVAGSLTVAYTQNTELFPADESEHIEPGAAIPMTAITHGTAIAERITKTGIAAEVPREEVQMLAINPIDRALRRIMNRMYVDWDRLIMERITAGLAHAQTVAGAAWTTGDRIDRAEHFMLNIGQAVDLLNDAEGGYTPDALIISRDLYRKVVANPELRRQMSYDLDVDGKIIDGTLRIDEYNLAIHKARAGSFPDPVVYDSELYGSIVSAPSSDGEGYDGLQITTRYYDAAEQSPGGGAEITRISVLREKLPIIQEPKAAVKLTGVSA